MKQARKILRMNLRLQRHLRIIDPTEHGSDERRVNLAEQLRMLERIVGAFEDARTDTELLSAMKLTASLTSFWADEHHQPMGAMQ
jgi:hypothetical protein